MPTIWHRTAAGWHAQHDRPDVGCHEGAHWDTHDIWQGGPGPGIQVFHMYHPHHQAGRNQSDQCKIWWSYSNINVTLLYDTALICTFISKSFYCWSATLRGLSAVLVVLWIWMKECFLWLSESNISVQWSCKCQWEFDGNRQVSIETLTVFILMVIFIYKSLKTSFSVLFSMGNQLANWLIQNKIVEHIFGPNLHVEVKCYKDYNNFEDFFDQNNLFKHTYVLLYVFYLLNYYILYCALTHW